ncbi:MAG: GNAT family N-acetyltransferase [bacterium]
MQAKTAPSFTLRPATASDAEDVANLFTLLGHATGASDVPARLAAVQMDGGAVFLAVANHGRVLGVMSLSRHVVIHAAGPVAYITGLITLAEARGQGVGRALVEEAKDWARREGCVRIAVTSAEHRDDAHAFYPKCGLPYTGRRFSAAINPSGDSS